MAVYLPVWNKKDFCPPPCVKLPSDRKDVPQVQLKLCQEVLNQTIHHLKDVGYWKAEEYILVRMLYRSCNNLRGQKIIQGMKRIKKCITIYKDMDLVKLLTSFRSDLPSEEDLGQDRVYLLSRQTAEAVQGRLLGGGALLGQTVVYCAHMFIHAQQMIRIGKYAPNMLVFANLSSRYRTLCIHTMNQLCACYKIIHQVSALLQPTSVPWLPAGESLPDDMEEWLLSLGYNTSLNPAHDERDVQSSFELNDFLSKFGDDVPMLNSPDIQSDCDGSTDRDGSTGQDQLAGGLDIASEALDMMSDVDSSVTTKIDIGEPVSRESLVRKSKMADKDIQDFGTTVTGKDKVSKNKKVTENVKTIFGKSEFVLDFDKVKAAIAKCQSGKSLHNTIRKSRLGTVAQTKGVKGFVKLQEAARELCVSRNINAEIQHVKNLAYKLLKKIKNTDSSTRSKTGKMEASLDEVVSQEPSTYQMSKLLQVPQSGIQEHFFNNITKIKHLRQLKKELEETKWTFSSEGQNCSLTPKRAKKMEKLILKSVDLLKASDGDKSMVLAEAVRALTAVFRAQISQTAGADMERVKPSKKTVKLRSPPLRSPPPDGGFMTEEFSEDFKAITSTRQVLQFVNNAKPQMSKSVHKKLHAQIKDVFADKSIKKSHKVQIAKHLIQLSVKH